MHDEPIDTNNVEPEPEGRDAPAIWPAIMGVVIGIFMISIGIIQGSMLLWLLGAGVIVIGLVAVPLFVRLPRDPKGGRRAG